MGKRGRKRSATAANLNQVRQTRSQTRARQVSSAPSSTRSTAISANNTSSQGNRNRNNNQETGAQNSAQNGASRSDTSFGRPSQTASNSRNGGDQNIAGTSDEARRNPRSLSAEVLSGQFANRVVQPVTENPGELSINSSNARAQVSTATTSSVAIDHVDNTNSFVSTSCHGHGSSNIGLIGSVNPASTGDIGGRQNETLSGCASLASHMGLGNMSQTSSNNSFDSTGSQFQNQTTFSMPVPVSLSNDISNFLNPGSLATNNTMSTHPSIQTNVTSSSLGGFVGASSNPGFISSLPNPIMSRNPLTSVCSPLGMSLPQSLKIKIINSEYVDFPYLLEKSENMGHDENEFALSVGSNGQLQWQCSKPKRSINSVHQWTSAFLIYSAVFLGAHPKRTQELLKYAYLIRTAAARHEGWGWRSYDIQFRLRQQSQPQRSWASIDGELWSLYVTSGFSRSFQSKSEQQDRFKPQAKGFRGPTFGQRRQQPSTVSSLSSTLR